MPQWLVPDGDLLIAGATVVGAANAYEVLNDSIIDGDDDSYLSFNDIGGSLLVSLDDALQTVGSNADHKIQIRGQTLGASQSFDIKITLSQSSDEISFLILFQATIQFTSTWEWYEIDVPILAQGLSSGSNAIQDYGNLYYTIQALKRLSGEEVRINQLRLQIPVMVDLQLTRHNAEIVGKVPVPKLLFTRHTAEVMARKPTAGLLLTRYAVEVMAKQTAPVQMTRYSGEVMARVPTSQLLLTSFRAEVIGRNIYNNSVNSGSLPTPTPNFLINNWIDSVTIETSWITDITEADSVSEERLSKTDRPSRRMIISYQGMTKKKSSALWININRHSHNQLIAPIFPDAVVTTAISTGSTIYCATAKRRFFLGAFVVIYSTDSGEATNVQYGKITNIFDDRIELLDPLVGSYAIGATVCPTIRTEINLGSSGRFKTDNHYGITLTLDEPLSDSTLFAIADIANPPPDLATFQDKPIFKLNPDWTDGISANTFRAGEQFESGNTTIVAVRGDRPQIEHEMELTPLTRDETWAVLQFFDYRKGRARPFFYVAPETLFDVVAASTTTLDIAPFGNMSDLSTMIDYVGILKTDGTEIIAEITSIEDNVTSWRINFVDVGVPLTRPLIVRATSGHQARFSSDTIREVWETTDVCSIETAMRDLLEEKSVVIGNLADTVVITDLTAIPDLLLYTDSDHYTWGDINPDRSALALQAKQVEIWDDVRQSPSDPYLFWKSFVGDWWGEFTDPGLNQGHAAMRAQGGYVLTGENLKYFGAGGFTIIVNVRMPGLLLGSEREYFWQEGIVEWLDDSVKLYELIDTADTDYQMLGLPLFITGEIHTLMLRWDPGVSLTLYNNGTVVATAAQSPASIPDNQVRETRFHGDQDTDANDFSDPVLIAKNTYYNAQMLFKRAITVAEMNTIGQSFKNKYGGNWNVIP